jgi:hypothetical protein
MKIRRLPRAIRDVDDKCNFRVFDIYLPIFLGVRCASQLRNADSTNYI